MLACVSFIILMKLCHLGPFTPSIPPHTAHHFLEKRGLQKRGCRRFLLLIIRLTTTAAAL